MRFVIVTGMSGGGKSTALKLLEDAGFYCVDNLPVPLIEKFIELVETPNAEIQKVALGLDVRTDQNFDETNSSLSQLRKNGYHFEILFMDANDNTLIKRYKETRRKHPLAEGRDGRLEDGIRREREVLQNIKEQALNAIGECADVKQLDELRVKYLGKKGELTAILKSMGKLSAEERPVMGQLANDVRQSLESAVADKQKQLKAALMEKKLKEETIDVTMPGKQQAMGVRHPLNIVLDELKEIFRGMG